MIKLLRGQPNAIATAPLGGVCLALVFAVVPLADKVAPWALAILGGTMLLRLLINRQGMRLPALPLKILLLVLGLGGVVLSYGGLVGVEPGLGILLILLSLKLLETNTVRDFQVLVLLGWFLCLSGFFFAQDLTSALYLGADAVLLLVSLIRFHQSSRRKGLGLAFRLGGKILLQALPLIVVLFFLFPRTYGGIRFQFSQSTVGTTGMSDRLSPGSVASLALSDAVAFRVDIPASQMPSFTQLYWRGAVLWHGEGLSWVRGPYLRNERRTDQLAGPVIRQRFMLQPHGGRWLFALDRPSDRAKGLPNGFEPGGFLQSVNPIAAPVRYEVTSRPENRESTLPADQHAEALRKPTRISPQVAELVHSWKETATSEREIIDAALRYFRKEKFTYSLAPRTYGSDGLTEFLFERRSGFCEHYAAAFATLMRIAGLPSRVVIGYQGGQYNQLGNYVIVRQLDAHAWTEVWLRDSGWVRIDPTDVIAPDRISSGSEFFRDSQLDSAGDVFRGRSAGATGLRELARDLHLFWDNLKYQWDLRVLNYDEETQQSFLTSLRLGKLEPSVMVLWTALAGLLLVGMLGLRQRLPATTPSAARREYERFCRRLATAGLPREPWEGPLTFLARAAGTFPDQATGLRQITELYISLRYSATPRALPDLRRAIKTLPRLRRAEPRTAPSAPPPLDPL